MSYDFVLQQALKLHNEGKLAEAENLYRQILEAVPDNPIILNLLGLIKKKKNLHHQAIEYFMRAIKQNPNVAEYFFNLAWSEERCGKYAEAIKDYSQALKMQPNIKEGYNALGNLYLKENNLEQATSHFNQALLLDPDYAEAKANLAKIDNDLTQLLKLENQYPSEPIIPYYIALIYRDRKQYQQAFAEAKKSSQLLADDATFVLLGELSLLLDNSKQAQDYFSQALVINPNSVSALINSANLKNKPQEAESLYKKALDVQPLNADAHINYADFLYRQHRLIEALEEYRHAVILAPKRTEISNNLGIIQKDLGEYEEALGLFFNALLAEPERKEYALNIAETLILLYEKDSKKAKQIAGNWLKNMPDNIFAKRISEIFNQSTGNNAQQYTQELFDLFAENYEQVMKNIDYKLPQEFARILSPLSGLIIDLGCGTGLIGEALKNENNTFIGVDISEKMAEIARAKKIYKEVIIDDITHYCQNLPPADWVVAADVFGYIGDLDNLLQSIFPRNLCFSIAVDEKCDTYQLVYNGRYRHNPKYIKNLLQKCGYSNIIEHKLNIRTENGVPVKGVIFVAKEK